MTCGDAIAWGDELAKIHPIDGAKSCTSVYKCICTTKLGQYMLPDRLMYMQMYVMICSRHAAGGEVTVGHKRDILSCFLFCLEISFFIQFCLFS